MLIPQLETRNQIVPLDDKVENTSLVLVERAAAPRCYVTRAELKDAQANSAFLDSEWKCRVCGLNAGAHPLQHSTEYHEASNERRQGEPRAVPLLTRVIGQIPVVSFLYDLVFDNTPTYDDVEKILNVLALLSALLLSVSGGMAGAIDYDQLEAFNDRVKGTCLEKFNFPSQLGFRSMMTDTALGMCIFLVVIVYLAMTALGSRDTGNRTEADFQRALEIWWKYNRFLVFGAALMLVLGTFCFFSTFLSFTNIKFPDPLFVEAECWFVWNVRSPISMRLLANTRVLPLTAGIAAVVASLPVYAMQLVLNGHPVDLWSHAPRQLVFAVLAIMILVIVVCFTLEMSEKSDSVF